MLSTIPTLYFPGSPKRVMVLDHQHRYLTSNDHPSEIDIAHLVFVSEDSHQMKTLEFNGHRCNIGELVQRIGAHMMASTDSEKGCLAAYKDKAVTSPYNDEEKNIGERQYQYVLRHQVDALAREVLSDIHNNHRCARLKKIERQLKIDTIMLFILRILACLTFLALVFFLYAACKGLKTMEVKCSPGGPMGMIPWCWIGTWHFE